MAIIVLLSVLSIPSSLVLAYSASTTHLVKDINPIGDSYPGNLTAFNGMLFFTARDIYGYGFTHGFELWRSDGTANGTVMLKDICPGTCSSMPHDLTVFNGALYFAANDGVHGDELWKTDGTSSGTVLVNPGPAGYSPRDLTVYGGRLYFSACDSTNGCELWSSNGTAAGTAIVRDICPGTCSSFVGELTPASGITLGSTVLFFGANDGTHGYELWRTDGSASGTVMVKDICPGSCQGSPQELTVVHRTLNSWTLFLEACSANLIASCGLWASDGTDAGTHLVRDINPGGTYGSGPCMLTAYNRMLFFNANNDTYGRELWRSDGTASGTVLVKDIKPGTASSMPFCGPAMTVFNGDLFFAADDGADGVELWRSNGTEAGTIMLKDINPGSNSSNPNYLTVQANMLFFAASDGVNGYELWKSDGTSSGTVLVKDICSGPCGSGPSEMTAVGSMVFFAASDGPQAGGAHGYELWVSLPESTGSTPALQAPALLALSIILIFASRLLIRRNRSSKTSSPTFR